MKFFENPKCYYNTVKLAGQILAIWPLKAGAIGIEVLLHEVKWWMSFLSITLILTPLILGVYYFRNDSALMTKALSETTAAVEFFMNLIQCKIQNSNFQIYQESKKGIKYIILKTNLTMTMAVVCGAYQLINICKLIDFFQHEPFEVVLRFILMVVAGSLKLYVSAKPADDLKENSEHLAQSAFLTALNQDSPSDARLALMLAYRCQEPTVISITGIIKAYCLEYYGLFLSTVVKYVVNLRAVLN